jgi:hypothetical protein
MEPWLFASVAGSPFVRVRQLAGTLREIREKAAPRTGDELVEPGVDVRERAAIVMRRGHWRMATK